MAVLVTDGANHFRSLHCGIIKGGRVSIHPELLKLKIFFVLPSRIESTGFAGGCPANEGDSLDKMPDLFDTERERGGGRLECETFVHYKPRPSESLANSGAACVYVTY